MKRLISWLLFTSSVLTSVSTTHTCFNSTTSCLGGHENVQVMVEVDVREILATTDETFLCGALDWYPADRCNYGSCSWDHASILNLFGIASYKNWRGSDTPANGLLLICLFMALVLMMYIAALYPFRVRLGGTLEDQIIYQTGNFAEPCLPLVKDDASISGYQGGCLSMSRWIALNELFQKTGTLVAFGLNALFNRSRVGGVWGPWNPSNARDFIKFTVEQGIEIEAWELGNELTLNTVVASIPAKQYAEDVKELRSILDSLYKDINQRPLLVAPDGTGNIWSAEYSWYNTLLSESGPGVVDVVTRHIYNLGPGDSTDLVEKILNPDVLDNDLDNYRAIEQILRTTAPWASAWVGEAGGAYNSGHHLVTDAFVMSFWYLDQLGQAASFNSKAFCRQSFIGGSYGVLNTTTFKPNPDFYSALLWKRLMGSKVITTRVKGYRELRAYTHCQKDTTTAGGLTILMLNLSNSTANVAVSLISNDPTDQPIERGNKKPKTQLIPKKSKVSMRLEYHLSAPNKNLHSQVAMLNGEPLELTSLGDFPSMDPITKENSSPVSVDPQSIVFVVLPNAEISICMMPPKHRR